MSNEEFIMLLQSYSALKNVTQNKKMLLNLRLIIV
jgi:hypothetical protein